MIEAIFKAILLSVDFINFKDRVDFCENFMKIHTSLLGFGTLDKIKWSKGSFCYLSDLVISQGNLYNHEKKNIKKIIFCISITQ